MPAALTREETVENIAALQNLLAGNLSQSVPLPPVSADQSPAAVARWLATVRGRSGALRHPRLALFGQSNARNQEKLAALQKGDDALSRLAETVNSDLQIYEVPVAAAGDETALLQAIAFGMTAVQPGLDVLGLGSLDEEVPTTIAPTLTGLLHSGRSDLGALCGAALAARLARVAVTGTGSAYDYAVNWLQNADPAAAHHMIAASKLLEESTGDTATTVAAAMAYLKSAAALHTE